MRTCPVPSSPVGTKKTAFFSPVFLKCALTKGFFFFAEFLPAHLKNTVFAKKSICLGLICCGPPCTPPPYAAQPFPPLLTNTSQMEFGANHPAGRQPEKKLFCHFLLREEAGGGKCHVTGSVFNGGAAHPQDGRAGGRADGEGAEDLKTN